MLLLLLTAGCVALPKPGPSLRVIQYDVAPGFMGASWDTIVIGSDGRGRYRHSFRQGRDWQYRDRAIRVTPEQFAAFERVLAPYRPEGQRLIDGPPECPEAITDQPTVHVEWKGGNTTLSRLIYDTGCNSDAMAKWIKGLVEAPKLIGIDLPPF